ncbi:protein Tob1 isoform X3 [Drosophila elegans]|uniref:protein Tob1 isoform X3 n=1 Tax=Drosophila elegans TaxID=30023 RepID=UPI0007E7C6AD|nr:protein Tob1 isoform X3 [Drosophila elegans]
MHIEIQVALNFVISYLYNKLPRRRVNIFGEELEKALRDKFQGHWYPEKPFKGSAYRCLKTGDPIDSVLERAARESGVPIGDILENLPNELSVWVDPGEVSFRIGEKGAVKILYTENNENHEDSHSADREVTKMFNPEAQCFRPIDAVNTTMNNLSLSPKNLPLALPQAGSGSSPHSAASSSPTYKGSPNPTISGSCSSGSGAGSGSNLGPGPGPGTAPVPVPGNSATANASGGAFMQRGAQTPLTFTTATFAQTKFGSTKLKTSSKRTNRPVLIQLPFGPLRHRTSLFLVPKQMCL